jgi:acetate kinase
MIPAILTVNAGSSSLKLSVYRREGEELLVSGLVDRIGGEGMLRLRTPDGRDLPMLAPPRSAFDNHATALDEALRRITEALGPVEFEAIGHRVVHGGPDHTAPIRVDDEALAELERLSPFAPLHQPHNLSGIRAARRTFPQAVQVACFDTAFHRNHSRVNDIFALPREYYEKGVRRYGFHGLSYEYITRALRDRAPLLHEGRVVIAHLGNGASACGVHKGRSIASTMGFSALDGLPMGTRCGQLDPGVLLYLMESEGMGAKEISDLLYKKSGLLGISGLSNDMRTLEASELPEAREAIDYFVFRVQREIGAMAAALGGIDALVFCGGIGENSRLVRSMVCARLDWMGIEIEPLLNAANAPVISSPLARTSVLVLPTNEEWIIARAAIDMSPLRKT